MNSARPPFRLRHLLNPLYVARRLRETRSCNDLLHRSWNVLVYIKDRFQGSYYDVRGLPHLIQARSEAAYYALRGVALSFAARAADRPRRGTAPAAEAAPPTPPRPSFDGPLLHPNLASRREELAGRFRSAEPFRHVVIDGFLDPAFCRALVSEFPAYDAERFRNEHGHLGKAYRADVARLGPSFRKLDELVKSPEFLKLVSAVTGIPDLLHDPEYYGGGTHENLEEMELDPHVDFTIHKNSGLYRRVNLLLYLNEEWDEAWGGGLELHTNPWLRTGENRISTVSPVFNRCVLFETSDKSWHGFRTIRLPADKKGRTRKSFALYLYTREKPRGFPSIPGDLTVFVDRPLPPRYQAGLTLSGEDVRVLQHAVVRRDWKLRHLYDRAIALYNEWTESERRLNEAKAALKAAELDKAALTNDLRLSRAQLREALEALLREDAGKTKP